MPTGKGQQGQDTEERERAWVRARLGSVTAAGWVSSVITGPGGDIIEIYIQKEHEVAMVSVLDPEVQWEVIPDNDPEIILESPCGSDDEGEEDVWMGGGWRAA